MGDCCRGLGPEGMSRDREGRSPEEGDVLPSDPVYSSWSKPSYAAEGPAAVWTPVYCNQPYLLSWVNLDFGKPKFGSGLNRNITQGEW